MVKNESKNKIWSWIIRHLIFQYWLQLAKFANYILGHMSIKMSKKLHPIIRLRLSRILSTSAEGKTDDFMTQDIWLSYN